MLHRLAPLKIHRYVVREVFVPTVVGFFTYTFLLLLRAIFVVLEQVLVRGVSARDAGLLILLSLPHVVVLTLPMSFLFGVLLGIGRMSSENEIIALEASGISLRRVLVPILWLGILLGGVNGYLTLHVMPRANQELVGLKVRLFSSAKSLGEVEPKIFYQILPGTLLYVRDINKSSGSWKGVLLFQRGMHSEENLIVAKSGRLVNAGGLQEAQGVRSSSNKVSRVSGGGAPWLLLDQVVTHQLNESKPQLFRVNINESQLIRLERRRGNEHVHYTGGMRARSTADLYRLVRGGAVASSPSGEGKTRAQAARQASTRRLAMVELQKRLAIPAACFFFGLIGLPLAMRSRSGGRGRGFLISLGVILAYYVALNHGELLSRQGDIPSWLGVWIPNLLVGALGLALLWKSGSWIGERSRGDGWLRKAFKRIGRSMREIFERVKAGKAADGKLTGSIPVALQRRRVFVAFPSLLDRYIASQLVWPLALVLSSTALLYIVVDFADKIDELAKHTASLGVFVAYYWNLVPQVILDVAPLALMISVLLLFVVLERRMELTAMKAGGISLYRVTVPVLIVASFSALGLAALQESIVPRSNREAKVLLNEIKGHKGPRSFMGTERQWLFSRDGSTLYNLLRYDRRSRTLYRFSLYRFDEDGNLRFILFADRAKYSHGGWVADSGWFRQIFPDGTDTFKKITRPMELDVPEAPTYFANDSRTPGEMSFGELRRYIDELEVSGYRPIQLIVRLYQKITYPLSAFVMVFLALPFGLNRSGGRRLSPMHGIAWGLGLGMLYFVLVALFGKLGEANAIPPVLGAWLPLLLAALFAANRLTTVRT